ncbi:MAG TPA: hypothetical protein VK930_15545 [Verrucomicrobiae bacterium]|jgi:hypothetical protein|nr:hypothetical protein [Verrucomicrobiae bacterium]
MSANADVLRSDDFAGSAAQESPLLQVEVFRGAGRADVWNPEDFAREQIRGLVQRVFFASVGRPVTQVVFSGAEPHMDVSGLCDQVGQALALETSAHIAVVGREMTAELPSWCGGRAAIKSWSRQTAVNLWRVPGFGLRECSEESGTGRYWISRLAELRKEFEYAVIEGPAAGISSEAALLGQLTDGIILVLGAHNTRRATARKIKETLEAAQSRILGTVLRERRFPVPERIYRRL